MSKPFSTSPDLYLHTRPGAGRVCTCGKRDCVRWPACGLDAEDAAARKKEDAIAALDEHADRPVADVVAEFGSEAVRAWILRRWGV